MTAHTPTDLPWKLNEAHGRFWISSGKGKKQIDICDVRDVEVTTGPDEVDADPAATKRRAAYIVAAANAYPLLQELANVLERYVDADGDDDDDDLYKTARAVLEKLEATKVDHPNPNEKGN